jgi:hypothetical protein
MLFNVFNQIPMNVGATNTISFNGYDKVFFTISCAFTFTGAGGSLKFYAKNENIQVLIKEFTNAELQNSVMALSFQGCPNEIKVEYSVVGGTVSGNLSVKANII